MLTNYKLFGLILFLLLPLYLISQQKTDQQNTSRKKIFLQAGFIHEVSDSKTKVKGAEGHARLLLTHSEDNNRAFAGIYLGAGALFFPGKNYYLLQPQARLGWVVETEKMAYDFGANASGYSGAVNDEPIEISSIDIGFHLSAVLKIKSTKGIYASFIAPAGLAPANKDSNIGAIYHLSVGLIF